VVKVKPGDWRGTKRVKHSTVVGYKPVRIVTGERTIDADIVEIGILGATIHGQHGQEPPSPVILGFNASLGHGDSGCLVFDMEFAERVGPRPYLIYQGVTSLKFGGALGLGFLIEQANKLWDLNCYVNDNP
jgi:hypothetical protein